MSAPDLDATFAFVDLAGFTAVTEAHGDREAVAIIQAFRARAQEVLGPDDELVKTIGDAVMLRFPTPTHAVVALQELIQREIATPEAVLLPRAGAHHGRAVALEGDYYGAAVNLASRVAGQAEAGQLLVTSEVASAAQRLGAVVSHLGTPELRNITDPIDLYEVRVGCRVVRNCHRPRLPHPRVHRRRPRHQPRLERPPPPLLRSPVRRAVRGVTRRLPRPPRPGLTPSDSSARTPRHGGQVAIAAWRVQRLETPLHPAFDSSSASRRVVSASVSFAPNTQASIAPAQRQWTEGTAMTRSRTRVAPRPRRSVCRSMWNAVA